MPLKNTLQMIHRWFEKGRPNPTPKDINTQLGCHMEERVELLDALLSGVQPDTEHFWIEASQALHRLAEALKKGETTIDPEKINRLETIDALGDEVVTGIGSAYVLKMLIIGALEEINESNWSKFDEDGNPIFDENKKIIKGENYRKACLDAFI